MPEAPTTAVADFLLRWAASGAAERANYQIFLAELCVLLDAPGPEPTKPDDRDNAYVEGRWLFAGTAGKAPSLERRYL